MPESNANEMWQVDVNGTVYDAAFSELPEWIEGGSLLHVDKVRKGNLRWIEARRVPSLVPFFNAKEKGEPMPVVVTISDATEPVQEQTVDADIPSAFPLESTISVEPVTPAGSVSALFDPNK